MNLWSKFVLEFIIAFSNSWKKIVVNIDSKISEYLGTFQDIVPPSGESIFHI